MFEMIKILYFVQFLCFFGISSSTAFKSVNKIYQFGYQSKMLSFVIS